MYKYKYRQPLRFQIRTGLLISGFSPWRHEERETQFLKAYANHTMLTPPQRVVHLVMFKISIHLCGSRSEKLNRIPQRLKTQLPSFQNSQILRTTSYGAWRYPHSSPISCLWVYYFKYWLSYPLRTSVKLHQRTMHLDQETRIVQSLTKLKDKI